MPAEMIDECCTTLFSGLQRPTPTRGSSSSVDFENHNSMCSISQLAGKKDESPLLHLHASTSTSGSGGGCGIYEEIMTDEDQDDIITILTTNHRNSGDLYDEAVMGLLDEGDASQKTNEDDDNVFLPENNNVSSSTRHVAQVLQSGCEVSSSHEITKTPPFIQSMSMNGGGSGPTRKSCSTSVGRIACFVGNLTWWTTHDELKHALKLAGAGEILDIKIFECRDNGQSKGYSLVTFATEDSLQLVGDNLNKIEIHGRNPMVKPDAKSSAAYFEARTKTRPPPLQSRTSLDSSHLVRLKYVDGLGGTSNGVEGGGASYINSANNVNLGPGLGNGNWYPGGGIRPHLQGGGFHPPPPRGSHFGPRCGTGLMGPRPACPPPLSWGHFNPRTRGGGMYRHHMPPRVPPPQGPFGIPPHLHQQQHLSNYEEWRPNYVPRVHVNPAFLNRLPLFQNEQEQYLMDEGIMYQRGFPQYTQKNVVDEHEQVVDSLKQYSILTGSPPPSERPLTSSSSPKNPATEPISSSSSPSSGQVRRNGNNTASNDEYSDTHIGRNEMEISLEGNESICTMAIQRAVDDASNGEYASAIETLVTAISIIRGSKAAKEKRCQVLISSLQESLDGIEHRSYGKPRDHYSKEKSRRSRSPLHYLGSGSNRTRDISSRDHYYHNQYQDGKENGRSSYSSHNPISRRRTWDERDREYSQCPDFVERDPRPSSSKIPRGEDYGVIRDVYRR